MEPVISATNESYQATMSSELTKTSAPVTSSTNVLVVEDEMVLRLRAVDIVEGAGFTAVEAVSADEALAIWNSAQTSRCYSRTSKCQAAWMD